ncbi:hypothetical protein B566_EDAN009323 [Ephemera danica]|nr:hypothetical protein B566_EDAN009323 [Ephemera danica]
MYSRDWCVSRQLWWGHRVPAYFCRASSDLNGGVWLVARGEDEARLLATRELSTSQIEIRQDTDVLDTWFSSALLPFSSLGWPDSSAPDLKRLFPLSLMETGHDILFFWVARMVMLSKQLTGSLPFKLLLDRVKESNAASGASTAECERALSAQRVSFPQGIPACGTDALRFTLVSHNVKAHTVTFDIDECHTNKLFCNKIWQATRFVLSAVQQRTDEFTLLDSEKLGLMERWILSRQANAVQRVEDALETFNLHEATAALKRFFYGEFCGVYLECSKPALRDELQARDAVSTLVTCLTTSLNLLAPFMPFLCEELYNQLPFSMRKFKSIHQAEFPTAKEWSRFRDLDAENDARLVLSVVHAIRRLKAEAALSKPETKIKVQVTEGIELELFRQNKTIIRILSACAEFEFSNEVPDSSLFEVLSPTCKVYLLGQHGSNIKWLQKKEKIEKDIEKLSNIMSGKGYSSKAPTNVQEAHKIKLERLQTELKKFPPKSTS